MNTISDTERDMFSINSAINSADFNDLNVEIIWSAMNTLKQQPELSIEQAIECGVSEWIK